MAQHSRISRKQSKGPDLEKSGFSLRDAAAVAANGKSGEPLKADTGGPFTRTTYTADRVPAIAIASVKWVISMSKHMGGKVYNNPNFSLFAGKVPIRIDISPALFLFWVLLFLFKVWAVGVESARSASLVAASSWRLSHEHGNTIH